MKEKDFEQNVEVLLSYRQLSQWSKLQAFSFRGCVIHYIDGVTVECVQLNSKKCYWTTCPSFLAHNGRRNHNTHLKKRGAREYYAFEWQIKFHRQMGEIPTRRAF